MTKDTTWIECHSMFGTNYVLVGKGFYISYNPSPGGRLSFFISDDGRAETALVYKEKGASNERYDILNGDFRDSYTKLVPLGLEACKEFYRQQSAHADSSWTSPRRASS